MSSHRPLLFRNRQFELTVIVICVRWYLRHSLSLGDVEELMAERACPWITPRKSKYSDSNPDAFRYSYVGWVAYSSITATLHELLSKRAIKHPAKDCFCKHIRPSKMLADPLALC
jgi:hypothetical protein